jgi:PPOX class probable F420-dependent enzyme
MGDKNMTKAAREAFLADLHVGVLGVERPDGPPLVVPVWYSYERAGDITILTSGASLKGKLLTAAGRASLCAQDEALPYKYVSVEGPVATEPLAHDAQSEVERMAIRYLGKDMGRRYADAEIADDEIKVTLTPERWFTVDYS